MFISRTHLSTDIVNNNDDDNPFIAVIAVVKVVQQFLQVGEGDRLGPTD